MKNITTIIIISNGQVTSSTVSRIVPLRWRYRHDRVPAVVIFSNRPSSLPFRKVNVATTATVVVPFPSRRLHSSAQL